MRFFRVFWLFFLIISALLWAHSPAQAALSSQYLINYLDKSSQFLGVTVSRKRIMEYSGVIADSTIASEFGSVYLRSGSSILLQGSGISSLGAVDLNAQNTISLVTHAEELKNVYRKLGFSGVSYG